MAKRISGRLAAKAFVESKTERAKRKLDYDVNKKTPQPKANGSILKHKRTSRSGRRSTNANSSASSRLTDRTDKNPLTDTTLLTTYTDFK
ncbi:jg1002, partial [Pararge aegeria aegeria]